MADPSELARTAATATTIWPIVELRRYALRPGARETLIELFDRELVETQEAVGMQVLGQFRDLDDPDSFVWLRAFTDMPARKRALEAFYGGPVWREHRDAANATMLDSDNVLLLRPTSRFELAAPARPPRGTTGRRPGLVLATIYRLHASATAEFAERFRYDAQPMLRDSGIDVFATLVTEQSENTFPALPVREDAEVFVWMATLAGEQELGRTPPWADLGPSLAPLVAGPVEALRLTPTARSWIHA